MTSKCTSTVQLRQGNAASTVLTNRSKYITVISDEPYESRKRIYPAKKYGLNSDVTHHRKGTRPMHQTSLTFEKQPTDLTYQSSSKQEYSGKKGVAFVKRPPQCPSLHLSQFQVGTNNQMDWSKTKIINSTFDPNGYPVHEDRDRWQREMKGTAMQNSLTFKSYGKSKTKRPSAPNPIREYTPSLLQNSKESYDIITGTSSAPTRREHYKKISGNRLLQTSRAQTTDGILG